MRDAPVVNPVFQVAKAVTGTRAFNTVKDTASRIVGSDSVRSARVLYHDRRSDVDRVLYTLNDDKSRRVYRDLLAYRSTRNRKYLRKTDVDHDMYFAFNSRFMSGDVRFVDCGAYDGDTIRKLLRRRRGCVKSMLIDAFEPDARNYERLTKYVAGIHDPSVSVKTYQTGVYDITGDIAFHGGIEDSCRADAAGESSIPVVRLDDILLTGPPVSFIKMDIEGSELPALIGARDVIRADRPYLAICIYHSDADMLDIPLYLFDAHPGYRWYVRHYSWFHVDTVLYGVPEVW